MQKNENHSIVIDKNLAAVCGLYCGACTFFIVTKEDSARLKVLACRKCGKEPVFNFVEVQLHRSKVSFNFLAKHKQAIEQCLKMFKNE